MKLATLIITYCTIGVNSAMLIMQIKRIIRLRREDGEIERDNANQEKLIATLNQMEAEVAADTPWYTAWSLNRSLSTLFLVNDD